MTLRTRLERLERNHPAQAKERPILDLPTDIHGRIVMAKEAGTFPRSLCDADLEVIVSAADKIKVLK